MNKKASVIGWILSLTLGQIIATAILVYVVYFAGKIGIFS